MKTVSLTPSAYRVKQTFIQVLTSVGGGMVAHYLENRVKKLLDSSSTSFTVPQWAVSAIMFALNLYGASITRDEVQTFFVGGSIVHFYWVAGTLKAELYGDKIDPTNPVHEHLADTVPMLDEQAASVVQATKAVASNDTAMDGIGYIDEMPKVTRRSPRSYAESEVNWPVAAGIGGNDTYVNEEEPQTTLYGTGDRYNESRHEQYAVPFGM